MGCRRGDSPHSEGLAHTSLDATLYYLIIFPPPESCCRRTLWTWKPHFGDGKKWACDLESPFRGQVSPVLESTWVKTKLFDCIMEIWGSRTPQLSHAWQLLRNQIQHTFLEYSTARPVRSCRLIGQPHPSNQWGNISRSLRLWQNLLFMALKLIFKKELCNRPATVQEGFKVAHKKYIHQGQII